jgi:hypothetical protein
MEAPVNTESNPAHIRQTVHRVGRRLEKLSSQGLALSRAFEIVARKAESLEEMVVIEVMREVFQEMSDTTQYPSLYADSNTRSARMPSIALSR